MLKIKLLNPMFSAPKTRVIYGNVRRGNRYPDMVRIIFQTRFFLTDCFAILLYFLPPIIMGMFFDTNFITGINIIIIRIDNMKVTQSFLPFKKVRYII